jgi:hypothetical protein
MQSLNEENATPNQARLVNRRGSFLFFLCFTHASTSTQLPALSAATAVPAFSRSAKK